MYNSILMWTHFHQQPMASIMFLFQPLSMLYTPGNHTVTDIAVSFIALSSHSEKPDIDQGVTLSQNNRLSSFRLVLEV